MEEIQTLPFISFPIASKIIVLANPYVLNKGNKRNILRSYRKTQCKLCNDDNLIKPPFCIFIIYQL